MSPTASQVPSATNKIDIDSTGDKNNILVQDCKDDILSDSKSGKSALNPSKPTTVNGEVELSKSFTNSFVHIKS